ncbi:MAG TPA: hypothetical protein VIS07_23145 [Candidatus Binatia bacterium]
MRRRDLQAYVIGAAIAGTALVLPYAGRALLRAMFGDVVAVSVPFFLLPIAWGFWNVLWVRLRPRVAPAAWGALLGVGAALAANGWLALRGEWFPAVALLVLWTPTIYAFAWAFVVVPLNRALGAEP